jgi:DNA-binding NarL/FixJ family response regulator
MDRYTGLALIIISNHSERALIELSLEEGVNAYILKNDRQSMQDLAEIVLQVAEGEVVIPEMTMELFRKHSSDMPSLTPRQWEALSIMFAYPERSQKELADLLTIKPSTFRNLVSQAYIRLGVGGRSAAHRKLSEMGFLPGSDLPPGLI